MTVGSFLQFKGVHADSVSFMPMATTIREAVKSLCPVRPTPQGVCDLRFAPVGTVHCKIKKALELGYKPSYSVPFHSGVEQAEQLNN